MQGTNPVASMVHFRNTKPLKREYRHYNIKTVEGPDDFASMEEVVFRRYRRLLEEERPLPQLIVIDGGKGQLSSAYKSLEKLGIQDRITIIGIAKRLEEIYFPNESIPLHLSKRSDTLKVIQHIRNEAHRFAITFHRDQRSREFVRTELTEIPGIGEKTANKLLSHFGSVKKVKSAKIKVLIESTKSELCISNFGFFFSLTSLKILTVTKAMAAFFVSLAKKIIPKFYSYIILIWYLCNKKH